MCYEQEALGPCVAGKDVFALILINQCCNYVYDDDDYVSVISIIIAITMLMIAMIILIIYIITIVITVTFPY